VSFLDFRAFTVDAAADELLLDPGLTTFKTTNLRTCNQYFKAAALATGVVLQSIILKSKSYAIKILCINIQN
jgi:hypothetical protein